jgi:hypothetical protein
LINRNRVYEMLTKEDDSASAWGKGKESKVPGVPSHLVSRQTGLPFSAMEWVTFAELYLNEAKTAYANYCLDLRTIRIRLLKAASMLVAALQVNGEESDLEDIAGVSRTTFPINNGGLKQFKELTKEGTVNPDQI